MLRFAANLSMLYPDRPFLDRFEAAAQDGFRAVEFFLPYAWPAPELAARLADNGLELALFNATPRPDPAERGIGCLPGREAEFQRGLRLALDYAEVLGCRRLHVMAGLVPEGAGPDMIATLWATFRANLQWAAAEAVKSGIELLIEPINRRDVPRYLLNRQSEAHELIERLGAPNLKVQMDLYHCQIVEGDVATRLRRYLPSGRVGHLQIAGVPDRHEPDEGELNYPYLFGLIEALGYDGWIGAEYHPRLGALPGGTRAGLAWRPDRVSSSEPAATASSSAS